MHDYGIEHNSQDTTGAVICAKSRPHMQRIHQFFRDRKVAKVYLALVRTTSLDDAGVVTAPLMRLDRGGVRLHDDGSAREAVPATTAWTKLATSVSRSLRIVWRADG
jgi:23S rRNA-/tRNA-specific pseudouridylate synthase